MKSSIACFGCAFIFAFIGLSASHAAEPFPSRPIRVIVPSATGGALDITTRLVAQRMSEHLGQPVIVDNRPGGDSVLGTRMVKDAPADGYTLLAHANAFIAAPALKLDPGYDPLKHFTGIGAMVRTAQVMYVGAAEPDKTVADFVSRARARPGNLTFAHGGLGSPLHMGAASFVHKFRLDVVSVPYKGAGAAWPDVAGGRVTSIFAGYTGGAALLQAGKLRPLGVTSSERLAALPNVPTFKEQGIDYTYYFWLGMFAPAGTPKDVVQRLADALKFATASKELTDRFRAEGSEAMPGSPDEFNAYVAKDMTDTAALVRQLGIPKD